ncbi:TerC family protein [Paenalkalicoccus suaedae]|uniref:TerC family protein n=1 Tax=Paenalkalicoccus suaedae TaxID=2592382 RepID=A0A859FBG7_9BACI|nr:TerC family protein [Paenalkalicoccus suaedae]QKS70168.1 TerC family protein [Paenalkalicoccus suaedae]
MEMVALLMEYGWTLLVLIALEGLLAADNALVLAMMVKHLPEEKRKKALFYGLFGAFVFRFASLFMISFLVDVWQVQAIGAAYLLFLCINHFVRKQVQHRLRPSTDGFWKTVFKVELADIAFAVDSILAAVALAVVLPASGLPTVGGMDGGHFAVIFIAGLAGITMMRFAAHWFIRLLEKRPQLEHVSYLIVGWVGVKLLVYTLAHPAIGVLDYHFPHSLLWKALFWGVLLTVFIGGFFWDSFPWSRGKRVEVKPQVKKL